jgi:cyclophilin family peptidyl-prolyl cis-trans isomerase
MRFSFHQSALCAAALLFSLLAPGSAAPSFAAAARAPGLYATIDTTAGKITARLYEKEAPKTVANFVALATGKKAWTDKRTGKKSHAPIYNGTIFHRVIKGFMIQGGGFTPDMSERDTGAPIKNEAGNGLKNDRGTLAMARTSVVNSATSQFFVNVANNAFLNHRDDTDQGFGYAVFGKVTQGMDVVDKIVSAPVEGGEDGAPSKPVKPVVIRKITITRVGGSAKK